MGDIVLFQDVADFFNKRYSEYCGDLLLNPHRTMAFIFDVDKTLTDKYMQETTVFPENGIKSKAYWDLTKKIGKMITDQKRNFDSESAYINLMLGLNRAGIIKDLSQKRLQELGKNLTFYPGLPEFFPKFKSIIENKPSFKEHNIKVEFYLISNGDGDILKGSVLAPYMGNADEKINGIYGNEFDSIQISKDDLAGILDHPENYDLEKALSIINTLYLFQNVTSSKKTQYIHTISKGNYNVNDKVAQPQRRIEYYHMTYLGDGRSDTPAFSHLNELGGRSMAVYPMFESYKNGELSRDYKISQELLSAEKVTQAFSADFNEGSDLFKALVYRAEQKGRSMLEVDSLMRNNPLLSAISH